jgi:hypothetical protein
LSHRPETNEKKEGKEFVKFVDGLANVARTGRTPEWHTWVTRRVVLFRLFARRAIVRLLITGVMNWSARVVKDEIYAFGANSFTATVSSVAFL